MVRDNPGPTTMPHEGKSFERVYLIMKNTKKYVSGALALAMALSCGAALADNHITTAGNDGTVPVVLNAVAATFKVTVPTSLPVSVDADGVSTPAGEAVKIVNGSYGQVNVKNIAITAGSGWELKAFDESAEDGRSGMTTEKVGTKKIAMSLTPAKNMAGTAGLEEKLEGNPATLDFSENNWAVMDGANDTDSDELAFTYAAHIPAQAVALVNAEAANVVFTIGWYTGEVVSD